MANSRRLIKDRYGKIFMPMNVEGNNWNENFITPAKIYILTLLLVSLVILVMWLSDVGASISGYLIFLTVWFIMFQIITRYVIFEESTYMKLYRKMKEYEITTPSIFWGISSIRDKSENSILTFMDGKIGVMVKLERDTIIGKDQDFEESHFDAISEFYRDIAHKGYSFVQLNTMEGAGNDPRIQELDKLMVKSDNLNIRKLMEIQIGHLKKVTSRTLSESDYLLIFSRDMSRIDSIVSDIVDSLHKILSGAYTGFKVLKQADIIEFVKEHYGVKYFDCDNAVLASSNYYGVNVDSVIDIKGVELEDGEFLELKTQDIKEIKKLASYANRESEKISLKSIKESLDKKMEYKDKNKKEIPADTLDEIIDI